jgi:hypothetical protein
LTSPGGPGGDSGVSEKQMAELLRGINKCATKETVDGIEQTLKTLQAALATKADRRLLDALDATVEAAMKGTDARIAVLAEFKDVADKRLKEAEAAGRARQQAIDEDREKLHQLETLVGKLKLDFGDLEQKLEHRASTMEVGLLKNSFTEYALPHKSP